MALISRAQARQHEHDIGRAAHGRLRRRWDGTRRLAHAAIDQPVYAALVAHHEWETGACYPGLRTLARAAGCAVSTAADAVRRLAAAGWIEIHRFTMRSPRGLRWHQRYRLLPHRRRLSPGQQEAILCDRAPPLHRAATKRARIEAEQHAQHLAAAPQSMRPEFERNLKTQIQKRVRFPTAKEPSRPLVLRRAVKVTHEVERSIEEQLAAVADMVAHSTHDILHETAPEKKSVA